MTAFKKCSNCKHSWLDRKQFLVDKELILNGYQVSFEKIDDGLFLFTDIHEGCNSTIAVSVKEFLDLYKGVIYRERKTGSDSCEGKCLNLHDLTPCKAECDLAHIREIMQIILDTKSN